MRNSSSLLTSCLLLLLSAPWIHPQVQQLAAFWGTADDSANYLFIRPEPAPENPALFQLFATSSLIASASNTYRREPAELVHDHQQGKVRFELWSFDLATQTTRQVRAIVQSHDVSLCLSPLEVLPDDVHYEARLFWSKLVDGQMSVPLQFDFPRFAPHELRF